MSKIIEAWRALWPEGIPPDDYPKALTLAGLVQPQFAEQPPPEPAKRPSAKGAAPAPALPRKRRKGRRAAAFYTVALRRTCLREAKREPIAVVARRHGVSGATIRNWQKGHPTMQEHARKLRKAAREAALPSGGDDGQEAEAGRTPTGEAKAGVVRIYPAEFRQQVVGEVKVGGARAEDVARKHGLPFSTVYRWLRAASDVVRPAAQVAT